ncbi:hypothetical protein LCGC14_1237480 [marine sediment metagenome]|uniref:Uncharacterized protein n=1 Tax=marine sediment metagenome TaxID=412755 RepID=A0A0F9LAY2_9ZZZZ
MTTITMTSEERSKIARDFLKQKTLRSIPQMSEDLNIPYGTLEGWTRRHSDDLKTTKDGRTRMLEMNSGLFELVSKYKPISKEARRKLSSKMKKSWKKRSDNGAPKDAGRFEVSDVESEPVDETIGPEDLGSNEFLAASEHIRKLGENLIFMADQLKKHEEKIMQIKSILFAE